MTLEREACVSVRHSFSVVNDLYGGLSGVVKKYAYVGRPGVNSVFNQFLYHRGGALYDLTCGYLVGHGVGQQLYDVHRNRLLSCGYVYAPVTLFSPRRLLFVGLCLLCLLLISGSGRLLHWCLAIGFCRHRLLLHGWK